MAGLDGDHLITVQDQNSFLVKTTQVHLQRIDQGTYLGSDQSIAYTCMIGSKLLVEGVMHKDSISKTYGSFILTQGNSGFDFTLAAFDRAELDQAGVPYKIIERPSVNRFRFIEMPREQKQKALILDNSGISETTLVGLLKPLSVTLKFY